MLKAICDLVQGPVSGEVTALDKEGMVAEARELVKIHDFPPLPTAILDCMIW